MNYIDIGTFSVNLFIDTIHKSNLEFILDSAELRNKGKKKLYNKFSKYVDILWQMLERELSKNDTAKIISFCEYGDISFVIEADDLELLKQAIVISKSVIEKWINKYNIEKMKA